MSKHFYHMVFLSPWPLLVSLMSLCMFFSLTILFKMKILYMFFVSCMGVLMLCFFWWQDVLKESTYEGNHSFLVIKGLKMGVLFFIVSEVFFFMSFFWLFYHSVFSPCLELGVSWPPLGLEFFNPVNVPLLNTMILLGSGFTLTWSHNEIFKGNLSNSFFSLGATVFLGYYFSSLQLMEYLDSSYGVFDAVYGGVFFMATGFHGLHVLIGSSYLTYCLINLMNFNFEGGHMVGFEGSIWYWHFVDVIWLFLYCSLYWWGI